MDVLEILNEIEDVVEASKPALFSSKIAIDKEEILDLVSELRLKLPDDIKQATWIKEERDRILNEAKLDGQKVVNDAKVELSRLLSEDSVMIEAQKRAAQMLADAKKQAATITLGSIEYSDKMLTDTQEKLKNIIETLNDNSRQLNDMAASVKRTNQ